MPENKDKYNRIIAKCFVSDIDLGKWMVQNGWALAYRYFSNEYVEVEEIAKNNKLGVWNSKFENPRQFRKNSKS